MLWRNCATQIQTIAIETKLDALHQSNQDIFLMIILELNNNIKVNIEI